MPFTHYITNYAHSLALLQVATAKTGGCSQCSQFKKSGRPSCCAPGGAWYHDCGNAGDLNVHHTWLDGLRACNAFARAASGEAAVHAMLSNEKAIGGTLNTTQQQNVSRMRTMSQQQTTPNATGSEPNADTTEQNGSQSRSIPQQQTNASATDSEPNAVNTDSKGCLQLTNIAVYSSLLLMLVHVQA